MFRFFNQPSLLSHSWINRISAVNQSFVGTVTKRSFRYEMTGIPWNVRGARAFGQNPEDPQSWVQTSALHGNYILQDLFWEQYVGSSVASFLLVYESMHHENPTIKQSWWSRALIEKIDFIWNFLYFIALFMGLRFRIRGNIPEGFFLLQTYTSKNLLLFLPMVPVLAAFGPLVLCIRVAKLFLGLLADSLPIPGW